MDCLPIDQVLEPLITALKHSPQVLLTAPPGAGKSTWLPVKLLQQRLISGKILLLEPRRLAARTVAMRLAEHLAEPCGETIGYRMRGEQKIGANTRLEVVTEGILTRMLQRDPQLQGIDLLILDEFHERNLQTDLALALLLDVQQGLRDDLRLLIMSATLDNQQLAALLPEAPQIVSAGRSFPVTRHYRSLPSDRDFPLAVAKVAATILTEHSGSLLVFLPGEREIRAVQEALRPLCDSNTDLRPLYGALTLSEQQQAITASPSGRRKVVLATNIAETSLTIDGIKLVLDSTFEKRVHYDHRSGAEVLSLQRISQASMTQRAGRAGRLAPGQCWHLLERSHAERLAQHSEPAILHSDLMSLQLELLAWGCPDPQQLRWIDPPPERALLAACQKLQQLGAITATKQLTPLGRRMAELGGEPRLAAILTFAEQHPETIATASLLVAILEQPTLLRDKDFRNAFEQPTAQWRERAKQLRRRFNGAEESVQPRWIVPLLLVGFADKLAYRRGQSERYQLATGGGAKLPSQHPLSRYPWLLVLLQRQVLNSADATLHLALPVSLEEITASRPELLVSSKALLWDQSRRHFSVWQQTKLGEIVVDSQPGEALAADELQDALFAVIRRKGLSLLPWNEAALQLRTRLRCAAEWLSEEPWPAMDDEALLDTLEQWLGDELCQLQGAASLASVNLTQALFNLLSWSQRQRLDSELPTHYTVPTGSRLAIRYRDAAPPVLAVRVQEMYGQRQSPQIALGRVSLVLELLSPAQRPIQVTQDLSGFWAGAWQEVRKEMKGRYPKHLWPEDPVNTLPTRRTKSQSS